MSWAPGYLRVGNSVQQSGAESSLARQWLPAAGGDGAWAARTGLGQIQMCGDIFLCNSTVEEQFADNRTFVFQSSCCHGCGTRVVGVATAGRTESWALDEGLPSECGISAV